MFVACDPFLVSLTYECERVAQLDLERQEKEAVGRERKIVERSLAAEQQKVMTSLSHGTSDCIPWQYDAV